MADDSFYIHVDTRPATQYLERLGKPEQLNYAVSLAINRVMKLIQDSVRGDMKSKINFRRLAFNMNAIKVFGWANKKNLMGTIGIDPRAENLFRLEEGIDHVPINGQKYLAIPNRAVFNGKVIRAEDKLYPTNLNLQPAPGGMLKGREGTFTNTDKTIILQRQKAQSASSKKELNKIKRAQRGRDDKTGCRILYTLVSKSRTPQKMNFRSIAESVVKQCFRDELIKACNDAIESAKK